MRYGKSHRCVVFVRGDARRIQQQTFPSIEVVKNKSEIGTCCKNNDLFRLVIESVHSLHGFCDAIKLDYPCVSVSPTVCTYVHMCVRVRVYRVSAPSHHTY